jgi:polyribonucleotide nucleotidyltransferase
MLSPVFYKHIEIDIPHVYMKTVIGKKGKNLKKCCADNGIKHAWFNMNRSLIEIWGTRENLCVAEERLSQQIDVVRKTIHPEEMQKFKSGYKANVPDVMVSGSLDDISLENVKQLIGKDGRNFKRITRESGVSFVWYNSQNHTIDIWGPPEQIKNAIDMLSASIKHFKKIDGDIDMLV